MTFNPDQVRKDFPFLEKDFIYFDSASTSLKPASVLDSITNYYKNAPFSNARGNKSLITDQKIKSSRKAVKSFLQMNQEDHVIFTNSATDSSILLANSIDLKPEDQVILYLKDHHSTISPWQHKNCQITPIEVHCDGTYSIDDIAVNPKTKLVVITQTHNLYGSTIDIKSIAEKIKSINQNIIIIVDASQSIAHQEIIFKDLKIDFLYFSGHKILSSLGVGVICAKNSSFSKLKLGRFNNPSTPKLEDFEVGTLNSPSIISLEKALNYITHLGIKNIEEYITSITFYLYDQLLQLPNIEFIVKIHQNHLKSGVLSFKFPQIDSFSLGQILESLSIIVRSSNFCNYKQDFLRVSLNFYNTKSEIDFFIKTLRDILFSKS